MNFWEQMMQDKDVVVQPKKPKMRVERDAFSHQFPYQKRFELGPEFPRVYFTRREAQSVFYLLQGKTMKESALIMNLSFRTVEFYLNNVKRKMKCNRKKILIQRLQSSSLILLFNLIV